MKENQTAPLDYYKPVPISGGEDEPSNKGDKKSMETPKDFRQVVPLSGGASDEPKRAQAKSHPGCSDGMPPASKKSMATPMNYFEPVPKSMPEDAPDEVQRWEDRRSYAADNSHGTDERVKK